MELLVIDSVRCSVPLTGTTLAEWAFWYFNGGKSTPPSHNYTFDDFEAAKRSCLEKGLLQLLSKRIRREPTPPYSAYKEYFGMDGVLDFTKKGHAVAIAIFPEGWVKQD